MTTAFVTVWNEAGTASDLPELYVQVDTRPVDEFLTQAAKAVAVAVWQTPEMIEAFGQRVDMRLLMIQRPTANTLLAGFIDLEGLLWTFTTRWHF